MRKGWIISLIAVLVLSLAISPALASPGNGHSGKGNGHSVGGISANTAQATSKAKTEKIQGAGKADINSPTSAVKKQVISKKFKKSSEPIAVREIKDMNSHWAKNAVEKAQSMGLIAGYQDGTFKPDASISNTEAMVIAVRLAESLTDGQEAPAAEFASTEGAAATETGTEVTEGQDSQQQADISEVPAWAQDSAKEAVKLKIINVNRFHSQVQATRAQMAVMLAKALGLEPADTSNIPFSDALLISPEDAGYIMALKNAGIISGTPDGKFNPNSSITRAQVAAMLAEVIDTVENGGTAGDTTQTEQNSGTDQGSGSVDQTADTSNQTAGSSDQSLDTLEQMAGSTDQTAEAVVNVGESVQSGESGTTDQTSLPTDGTGIAQ